ncbi:50S ribosomal protein L13 [Aurantiacibacter atlanticus]|uniref:50S ribosomal protein L13 n=1 Tax=Aurantiacibacter atlanticus TaxID=1648404 RepID=A0A0H4W0J1_9SPHN|nr:hypothetical protein [Aurantiacibacter atlanticus]AKQ43028.2 50S ribosomal protein L13 [Aurantiacibacter atlanticus]MDF1834295.1 hypothetical protein [Alteraurantiacibacter sp. bin_em_oilr2.035]
MISFFKAVPFGAFLALIVALFMGSGGATGGMLNITKVDVYYPELMMDFSFYWSWMLFLAGTFLAFIFLLMMGD